MGQRVGMGGGVESIYKMVARNPNTSVNTNKSRENFLATETARLDKRGKLCYRLL